MEKAEKLILEGQEKFLTSDYVGDSLFSGRAGVLLVVLMLYVKTNKKEFLDVVDAYSRKIIANAYPYQGALVWFAPHQLVTNPLFSLGNGVAGIAYVFYLLNLYFKHPPYEFVYKMAVKYLEDCKSSTKNEWFDYERTIKDKATFSKYIKAYQSNDTSLSENMKLDTSIANGKAGVLFFYSKIEKENISRLLEAIKSELSEEEYELGKQLGEPICFLLPSIELRSQARIVTENLLTEKELSEELFRKKFPKVSDHLLDLSTILEPTLQLNLNADFLQKKIEKLSLNSSQEKILQDLISYEDTLWMIKMENISRLDTFIETFVQKQESISRLKIKNEALLNISLELPTILPVYKYTVFQDSDLENNQVIHRNVLLGKNHIRGIEENPLGLFSPILNLFKKKKRIKDALTEMTLFCAFQKESDLVALIQFSNSKDKKDLLDRLPFLFLYQIRNLVADGYLVFSKTNSTSFGLKHIGLRAVLFIANTLRKVGMFR